MAINRPGIEELKGKTDSNYTLVLQVAKRARQLIDGAQPLVNPKDRKPIGIAIEEINRGLLSYHRNLEDED